MDATTITMAILTHPLQVVLAVVVLAKAVRAAFSAGPARKPAWTAELRAA